MARTQTVEVEVEVQCEDKHCDEATQSSCPILQKVSFNPASLQRAFDSAGPALDRHTDWWRCQEEPWVSIAREMMPHSILVPTRRSMNGNSKVVEVPVKGNVL